MNLDKINDIPDILMEFLEYHSTVKGHSDKTIAGYYLDLKILFRYLKRRRHLVPRELPFNEIDITDIDIDFIKSIRIEEPPAAAAVHRRSNRFSAILPLSGICWIITCVRSWICQSARRLCRSTLRNRSASGCLPHVTGRLSTVITAS